MGAEYEDKAPAQMQVLNALQHGPETSKQLFFKLGKDKGQISNIFSTLSNAYNIMHSDLTAAWKLVTKKLLT